MKLELTEDESNVLAALLDLAVKAGGIRSAASAAIIFQKLEAAVKEYQDKQKEQA